jgi:NSS family neurotransmitter:Na+ symporter
VILVGLAVWFAGLVSLFSFNLWAEYLVGGATVFRWLELLTGGLMIPLVAVLIAFFTGWGLTRNLSKTMLGKTPGIFGAIWFWVMRLVLPLAVVYIGIHYTASSLGSLCDNGSEAFWCEPVPNMVEREGGGEASESVGAGESGSNPDKSTDETGELLPAEQAPENKPAQPQLGPESAPKDDDILYHSV